MLQSFSSGANALERDLPVNYENFSAKLMTELIALLGVLILAPMAALGYHLNEGRSDPLLVDGFDEIVIQSFAIDRQEVDLVGIRDQQLVDADSVHLDTVCILPKPSKSPKFSICASFTEEAHGHFR